MAAVIIAPITPVAAASDGVAIPSKISPITEKITMKKGDTLIILEAMKMQHEIKADIDGSTHKLNISEGSQVSTGDLLLRILQN